jgi:DedD protein
MDQQLKQRLIGAAIIVSLIVIFVPMFFEDRSDSRNGVGAGEFPELPKTLEERSIALPKSAADAAPSEREETPETGYRIIPLDDPPPKKAAKGKAPSAEKAGKLAGSSAEEDFAPAGEAELDRPILEKYNQGPDPVADDSEFSEEAAAPKKSGTAAKAKPQSAKKSKPEPYPSEPSTVAEGVPEIGSAPAASAAQPKTKPTAAAKPPKPAPAKPPVTVAKAAKPATAEPAKAPEPQPSTAESKPTDPANLSAWVVQTGSFTGESNARMLADKLRKANFAAFVEVVPGESGGSVYRVRVGPELNRSRAEQIRTQIENAVGVKGIIVPHH